MSENSQRLQKSLRLLSISQLERMLPMHRKTIERLLNKGGLPYIQINRRKFVRESDLNDFLAQRYIPAGPGFKPQLGSAE